MKGMKVLVPLDDSEISAKTINSLIAMQGKFTCPLTLLHVCDPERLSYRGVPEMHFDMIRERARKAGEIFIEKQRARFAEAGMEAEVIMEVGPARKIIIDIANSGDYDLLIIGRHSDGEFRNLLFGYVSNYVFHRAKCPVMVI